MVNPSSVSLETSDVEPTTAFPIPYASFKVSAPTSSQCLASPHLCRLMFVAISGSHWRDDRLVAQQVMSSRLRCFIAQTWFLRCAFSFDLFHCVNAGEVHWISLFFTAVCALTTMVLFLSWIWFLPSRAPFRCDWFQTQVFGSLLRPRFFIRSVASFYASKLTTPFIQGGYIEFWYSLPLLLDLFHSSMNHSPPPPSESRQCVFVSWWFLPFCQIVLQQDVSCLHLATPPPPHSHTYSGVFHHF
jgi:hypothetical protein